LGNAYLLTNYSFDLSIRDQMNGAALKNLSWQFTGSGPWADARFRTNGTFKFYSPDGTGNTDYLDSYVRTTLCYDAL
jgi:hypothetical protein